MAIHPQRIGQRPGIQMIGLGTAGGFALPIAGRRGRIDRIERVFILKQLIHRRSLTRLDRHRHALKSGSFLAKAFPSFDRMVELEVGNNLALPVHHHYHVMIACPVKASIMSDFFPFFHGFSFFVVHRGAVERQPDTRSLAGYCSLRLRDRRRQRDRCAGANLRKVWLAGP